MHSLLLISVIVLGSVAAGVFGLMVTHRFTRGTTANPEESSDTSIYDLTGTIYAVLLAFAVVLVWQSFANAKETVSREANALADVERMSRGFSVPVRRGVQEAARTYARVVMEDEWALMKQGESSPLAHAALIELWYIYTDMSESEREHELYGESVSHLNQLSESRRVRLFALKSSVPNVMWAVFIAGGVGIVLSSYLLPVAVYWKRKVTTACMIALIALSFVLILELNRPFSGLAHIESTPFQFVLDNMQQLER